MTDSGGPLMGEVRASDETSDASVLRVAAEHGVKILSVKNFIFNQEEDVVIVLVTEHRVDAGVNGCSWQGVLSGGISPLTRLLLGDVGMLPSRDDVDGGGGHRRRGQVHGVDPRPGEGNPRGGKGFADGGGGGFRRRGHARGVEPRTGEGVPRGGKGDMRDGNGSSRRGGGDHDHDQNKRPRDDSRDSRRHKKRRS